MALNSSPPGGAPRVYTAAGPTGPRRILPPPEIPSKQLLSSAFATRPIPNRGQVRQFRSAPRLPPPPERIEPWRDTIAKNILSVELYRGTSRLSPLHFHVSGAPALMSTLAAWRATSAWAHETRGGKSPSPRGRGSHRRHNPQRQGAQAQKLTVSGSCAFIHEAFGGLGNSHKIALRRNRLAAQPDGAGNPSGLVQVVLDVQHASAPPAPKARPVSR